VSGARIDVGEQARIALVRAALGLDRNADEEMLSGIDEVRSLEHHEHPHLTVDPLQDGPIASSDDEVKPE
jgi:hypothetical protein